MIIKNQKVEVPKTTDMNEKDILNDVLLSLKDLSNNYSIALNEMSCKALFKDIYKIFDETKEMCRDTFELAFEYGWYILEESEEKKKNDALIKIENMLTELEG